MDQKPDTGIIRVELIHNDRGTRRVFKDTMGIFRSATSYLAHVICDHWEDLSGLDSKTKLSMAEKYVHHTKCNPDPEYGDFDIRFPDLPSYVRRSAINAAVGHVQSHETRCSQYYENRGKAIAAGAHYKKLEPGFTYTPNACPTMYNKETYTRDANNLRIKVFIRNTWDWVSVPMAWTDFYRLMEAASMGRLLCPKLVYEYHKYYLEFPVEYDCLPMQDVPLDERKVLSVDLGFNHGAVCSVIGASGTVLGRSFDPFKADMGRIDHVIGLIRKKAASSGRGQSLSSLYTKLEGLKDNYAKQLARWIINIAIREGCYGIVLENLSSLHRKKKCGRSLRARLHHWTTAKIRGLVKGMAYRAGIRTFIINPWGTSKYAFDGSGEVERDEGNYALCTFQNGKRYNADLSASYNIGARYFIRELMKSIKATLWSELKAKVPGLSTRTKWTLDTLCRLQEALAAA